MRKVSDELRLTIGFLERGPFEHHRVYISSSYAPIDAWLPQSGFELGSFIELLQDESGVGGYALVLRCARRAAALKPAWVVLDTEGTFYPPAAAMLGWDVQKLILIRAKPQDGAWAFAQILRSKDIGACFWASSSMDNMVFRRLQLAAERGGGLGFVLRPMAALRKPCWGSLRIQVMPSGPGKVRLRLLHARGQPDVAREDIEVAL